MGTCRRAGRRGNVQARAEPKRVHAAAAAPTAEWDQVAKELDEASPLEIIDYVSARKPKRRWRTGGKE
eukprot:scaffold911_cov314-Pavlova_lutheri.AAC.10